MAKLQVLSDESGSVSRARRLIPTRRKCYGNDDKNKNTNNININFGTNVEHSHNVDSGDSRDDGRFVNNVFNEMIPQKQIAPISILRPTGNNNFAIERNTVAPEYRGFRAENKVVDTVNKKVIVNNKRPKFVPNSSKNYYPEFP